jgi:spore coat polysaccharide biosynthesis protein SpsF
MHAATVDQLLDTAEQMGDDADVLAGGPEAGFPLGFVPEVARADAVLRAARDIPAGQDFHRSHVLSWLYQIGRMRLFSPLRAWPRRPDWRWTVDTPADLDMAQAAFTCFGDRWANVSYSEMVELLDGRPDITALNQSVRQKMLTAG